MCALIFFFISHLGDELLFFLAKYTDFHLYAVSRGASPHHKPTCHLPVLPVFEVTISFYRKTCIHDYQVTCLNVNKPYYAIEHHRVKIENLPKMCEELNSNNMRSEHFFMYFLGKFSCIFFTFYNGDK